MRNKVVLHFCIIMAMCMVSACNGAEDDSKSKKSPPDDSKKADIPPLVVESCKNTAYPGLCKLMIGTDPGAKNADLTKLTLVSIRVATFSAIENVELVGQMQKEKGVKGDEEALKCYKNCSECYSSAVEGCDDSLVELMKKNYGGVRQNIRRAAVNRETCQKCFAAIKNKDAKETMSSLNEMYGKLCIISMSFVNALEKAKP